MRTLTLNHNQLVALPDLKKVPAKGFFPKVREGQGSGT